MQTAVDARPQANAALRDLQGRLDAVTFRIRVETSTWLAIEPSVHGAQAELRRSPRARAALQTLHRLLPTWLTIKGELHGDYRQVKALLVAVRQAVGGTDPARWQTAWPVRVSAGPTFEVCPVQGPVALPDTFGAPRPGGRFHEGNDLFSARGTPVVAVQTGVVRRAGNTLGGRSVILSSATGYSYYAHLAAYGAAGSVRPGDVIGYVGASGDAKGLITQLHFEWHPGGGAAVDPFPMLQAVC
jgi:murein DD-endopeptidase MepM/ murein hydrolase activator NlpD